MFELSKQFRFDSAHALERDVPAAQKQSSRRIHGHSFRAEVTVRGEVAPQSGMVVDFDVLESALDGLRHTLDHRMLNDIPGLEIPTVENLCLWIWQKLADDFPALSRVAIHRDSIGDSCVYYGSTPAAAARSR